MSKKTIIYFAILFSLFSISFSQVKNNITKNAITVKESVKIPDSKVITINLATDTKSNSPKKNESMPWIAAIIVGVLTVFTNILISVITRKTTLKVITLQVESSKQIALSQIENAQKATEREFNKTVLSGNRQAWINDLRENVSKLISILSSCSLRKSINHIENEEVGFIITKISLMLNPKDDKELIASLSQILLCTLEITMGNKNFLDLKPHEDKLLELTQKTLKTEWERVKKGQ